MNKRVIFFVITVMSLFCIKCFCFTDYEKSETVFDKSAGYSFAEKERYEIITDGKEIYVFEIRAGEKRKIKSQRFVPGRMNDVKMLEKGILAYSLEEALMVYEDFVS